MPQREVNLESVGKVLVEELGVTMNEIKLESSLTKDLGADSLDVVEVVMALEEQFGVTLPDTVEYDTVSEIIKLIETVQAGQ